MGQRVGRRAGTRRLIRALQPAGPSDRVTLRDAAESAGLYPAQRMSALTPPFSYAGGKTTLAGRIVDLFPPHQHYIEPFAGSLAVLLAKAPSRLETVNDLDGAVIAFWKTLRDQPEELARICALTPHSRAERDAAADLDGAGTELELARRVWIRLTQGRAGTLRPTGWRHYQDPAGTTVSMPGYLAGYVARMPAAAQRLARVSLECRPALDLIADYGRSRHNLIYADPPYLGTLRSSSRYRCEMAKEAEHRDLAHALLTSKASVVLSGYPSLLYDELYADWYRVDVPFWTGQGGAKRSRVEVIWSNRPVVMQADLFEDTAT